MSNGFQLTFTATGVVGDPATDNEEPKEENE